MQQFVLYRYVHVTEMGKIGIFVKNHPNNKRVITIVHTLTMKQVKLLSRLILLIIFFLSHGFIHAQILEDQTYKSSIKTVLFHPIDSELAPPIIDFHSNDKLTLSFDDLDAGYVPWQYTLIHCNADWTPTDLWQNEYLDGFTDDYIRDYASSFNTLQPFTNYWVEIPNRNLQYTLPGNYIIKVYYEGNPDEPILTRRFMVVDTRVKINATVHQTTLIEERYTHQEVSFSILNPNYMITDPTRGLKVVVLQNDRWDNAKFNLVPLMLRSNELDYRYTDGTISFEAGNEFRYFDIKSLRFNSERVTSIESRNNEYYVTLTYDKSRAFKPYITETDLNGRFIIKTDDGRDNYTESEYVWVDFFLAYEVPFPDGEMFIVGGFNDWKHDKTVSPESGRMKYNYARQGYEARLLLKQGYYNYLYAFVDNKTGKIDLTQIEGNRYETFNNYTILVYNREQGSSFDRLIAVERIEN